jgi:hypothetical protein
MGAAAAAPRVGTALRQQLAATFPSMAGKAVPGCMYLGPTSPLVRSPPRLRRRLIP